MAICISAANVWLRRATARCITSTTSPTDHRSPTRTGPCTCNAVGLLSSRRGDARVAPPCHTTLCVWRSLPSRKCSAPANWRTQLIGSPARRWWGLRTRVTWLRRTDWTERPPRAVLCSGPSQRNGDAEEWEPPFACAVRAYPGCCTRSFASAAALAGAAHDVRASRR